MEKKQKVWIRGNEDYPEKVIGKLVKLGGEDTGFIEGSVSSCIYFIDSKGRINSTRSELEFGKKIMEEYQEIKLEEKAKDGPVNKTKNQQEFKVDDMVLRRGSHDERWKIYQYWYLLSMGGLSSFAEVIPYNEETKHLFNTTDNYTL